MVTYHLVHLAEDFIVVEWARRHLGQMSVLYRVRCDGEGAAMVVMQQRSGGLDRALRHCPLHHPEMDTLGSVGLIA